jgi:hypothetical protein
MGSFFKSRRFQPPLHLAVMNDDFAAISLLKHNPEQLSRKNWLGFTALELAHLLGKEAAIAELVPKSHPPIACQLNGQEDLVYCNRAEFEQLFEVHYISGLYFPDNALLEEVIKKCPWLLLHTIIGQEHRSLGSSLRRQLYDAHMPNLAIKWIDEAMGYGLFTEEPIAKECFIGQYAGVVRKIRRFSPDLNGYCMHLPSRFGSFDYFIIDAEKAGNELRFANHSDTPNMRPVSVIDRGLLHIGLFALRNIDAGEELTFDYGKDYWRKREKM